MPDIPAQQRLKRGLAERSPIPSQARLARGLTGATRFDSQSGPRDSGRTNGLSIEDLKLILGFDFYKAKPKIDPATGHPMVDANGFPIFEGTMPGEYLGLLGPDFRAGGGAGRQSAASLMSAPTGALRSSPNNVRLLQGLTVKQAVAFLHSLSDEELELFQVQMMNAGYYEGTDRWSWGILDDATKQAFQTMMRDFANKPELTVQETLEQAKRGYSQHLADQLHEKMGTGKDGTKGGGEILLQPELTSAETLADMVDQISQEMFGRDATPGEKTRIVNLLRDRQRQDYTETTVRQKQIDIKNNRPAAVTGGEDIDAFLKVISDQESGGDPNVTNSIGAFGLYQIMPDNWVPWAREAGADPNDRSAANQTKIARFQMLKYFNHFGNWRDVAVAWYGGGGAVGANWADVPQAGGHPSLNQYGDQVMARMNAVKGGGGAAASTYEDPMLAVEFRDKLDLTAEARAILRAANPAEYEATRWFNQARSFFSLLSGVV